MKRSKLATVGDSERPGGAKEGAMFAAPVETSGTPQQAMVGHIIVLPGGLLLVDDSLPAHIRAGLGRIVSGPIECKNGRP